MKGSAKKASLKAKLFIAALPFLLVLLLEGGVRLFAPAPDWHYDARVLAEMIAQTKLFEGDVHAVLETKPLVNSNYALYEGDRTRFWRLKPGFTATITNILSPFLVDPELRKLDRSHLAAFEVKVNDRGYGGPSFTDGKAPGCFRIVCVGDSNTFGWGVNPGESYPAVLAKRLEMARPGRKVEVINLGVPGYSSCQGAVLVEEQVLGLEPDLVIVALGYNDKLPVARSDRKVLAHHRSLFGAAGYFLGRSRLLLWCRILAGRLFPPDDPPSKDLEFGTLTDEEKAARSNMPRRVSPDAYRENLLALCGALSGKGTPLVLLDLFCEGPWEAVLNSVAQRRGVLLIDGDACLAGCYREVLSGAAPGEGIRKWALDRYGTAVLERSPRLYLYNDVCHPNARGYELIAERVAEELLNRYLEN